MKAFRFLFIPLVLSLGMVALGKSLKVSTNDPLTEGKYYLLGYEESIEILGKKESLRSAPVSKEEIAVLNGYIVEYIKGKNRSIEPEVKKEIQRSPHNAGMIKNSKYLLKPETYYYQLISAVNKKGQKLIFVNGIHSSSLGKDKELNKLMIVADGKNLYFNFWVNFATGEVKK